MRDLQRLEKLSASAALGLWADDVVLALDRTLSQSKLSAADRKLLNEAADMLEAARERTEKPLATPKTARALTATDSALSAVAALAQAQTGSDEQALLSEIASSVREAATAKLTAVQTRRLMSAMTLFDLVGEFQLAESNSVLASRKDARPWMEMQLTSSFS